MLLATSSRVLQFRAGPQEQRFYACDEHRSRLEQGDWDGNFFGVPSDLVESVEPDVHGEIKCDYCREG